jgi:mycofactocin precursor
MENSVVSTVEQSTAPVAAAQTDDQDNAVIEAELLIEEISIDGMCGVY